MKRKVKGTIFVLICVPLWALIPVVAKMGQVKLDNHQFLFWSSLGSFLILFAIALFSGKLSSFKKCCLKDYLTLFGLGMLGTYIFYLLLYLGYARTEGMEVLVVQYSWPILIVILSTFILNEPLNFKKIIAVFSGFTGVAIVLTKGNFSEINIANGEVILLVLAGSTSFALFSVLSKRVKNDPMLAVTVYYLAAAIASFVSMLLFSGFDYPATEEILPILINGIFVNGISYLLWILALNSTEASYLAPFTYLTPILSAVYLIIFFDEVFLPVYVLGLLLVVGGGLMNSLNFNRKKV